MNIQENINQMKSIQLSILRFLEEEENIEENFQNINESIKDLNIENDKKKLKLILVLIARISINHYRTQDFFNKLEKILALISKNIREFFTSFQIFYIFRKNKRILLYFLQNKIIEITNTMVESLLSVRLREKKYHQYFFPEIISFIDEEVIKKMEKDINPDFEQKRKEGENDSYLCEIIRKDDLKEFIIYENKTSLLLDSKIEISMYETNYLLFIREPTLIEYAAFFGSIQIFKYLFSKVNELTNLIWIYSIHGQNQEIIDILANSQIKFPYERLLKEAIKCHHNNIANYIINNFNIEENEEDEKEKTETEDEKEKKETVIDEVKTESNYEKEKKFEENIISYAFHYNNYDFFPDNFDNNFIFYYLCKYDYYYLLEMHMKNLNQDINEPIIENKTGIHLAAMNNNMDIVGLLLSQPNIQIGNDCFHNWYELITLNVPTCVTSLGENSFKRCISLETVNIPSSVSSIGAGSFQDCCLLTSITIPSSLTKLENSVFYGCISLKEIEIPPSVTSIGKWAFKECKSLEKITIPSSVTEIGIGAFNECVSLKEIMVPQSVTSIGTCAFKQCISLTQFSLPSSITTIGDGYFEGCTALSEIKIPDSITSIGEYAFNKCSSLSNIKIPSSVTLIGKAAFKECSSLKQITIPSKVTKVGSFSFVDCSSLNQINFETPSSINKIKEGTFQGCSSLDKIIIPSSVTKIGPDSFNKCSSLKQIEIPSSVTCIYKSSFRNCDSLPPESIPSSLLIEDPQNACLLI